MHWQHDWMDALQHKAGAPASGLRDARVLARFEVYRASFEANLCGALRDTYPVVNRLVGEAFFDQVARAYWHAHPSHSGDLHEYGAHFASFLTAQGSLGALPYLRDVARLEWLAHQTFHAAEAGPLGLAALAELPPEAYGDLCLLPCVRLMRSEFPVHRIWQVNQPGWQGDAYVDLDTGNVLLAVSREALDIVLYPLDVQTYRLAEALCGGMDIATACENLLARTPNADAGAALHDLIRAGLIATPVSGATKTKEGMA